MSSVLVPVVLETVSTRRGPVIDLGVIPEMNSFDRPLTDVSHNTATTDLCYVRQRERTEDTDGSYTYSYSYCWPPPQIARTLSWDVDHFLARSS